MAHMKLYSEYYRVGAVPNSYPAFLAEHAKFWTRTRTDLVDSPSNNNYDG